VTLLALDTATIYYRSYFALPESMTAPDGFPHNAVRGTLSTIASLVEMFGTQWIAAAWDADWRPQWRVDLVPGYKTHRVADEDEAEEVPDTLGPQIGGIAQILDALGIARPAAEEFEADDVLASIAEQCGGEVIVVTNDRDLVQVIDDTRQVRVFMMANGGMDRWQLLDEATALGRFGVPPDAYVDMAVLRGDPSDGLPGVPGVGPKTAVALVQQFGGLDAVLTAARGGAGAKPLTERIAGLITTSASQLEAAHRVATAVTSLPMACETFRWTADRVREAELTEHAAEWGVERFVDRLRGALQAADDAAS
jgi:5'-3' exonuclease